jgi:hypothetical protein
MFGGLGWDMSTCWMGFGDDILKAESLAGLCEDGGLGAGGWYL